MSSHVEPFISRGAIYCLPSPAHTCADTHHASISLAAHALTSCKRRWYSAICMPVVTQSPMQITIFPTCTAMTDEKPPMTDETSAITGEILTVDNPAITDESPVKQPDQQPQEDEWTKVGLMLVTSDILRLGPSHSCRHQPFTTS